MTSTKEVRRPSPLAGKGELIVVALVAAIGLFLLVQSANMAVPGTAGFLGPRFFPIVVGIFLLVLSALLAMQTLRTPRERDTEQAEGEDREPGGIDWQPLGIVALTLALHAVLLEPLGWLIAGAGLFFGVSYALGGRHVLRDLGVSFVVAAAAQLGFSAGLGIALPAGILGGVV
ncbi:MAG: tripartite tricarboxylate transporter TctB family protein [Pseudonocardiaceae bacterium]|nr:tripartite tricarboxylate transporter TctB family protein [Pseudonocardiaceae bacterium]